MPVTLPSETAPVPFPYGVADAGGRTGYLADGGGIRAVDLQDGRTLWQSQAAERPLLVAGDQLVALQRVKPSSLVVVVLDAASGAPLKRSDPIQLPDWVTVGLVDNDRFTLRPRLAAEHLEIDWQAHSSYEGGAQPPAEVLRQGRRSAQGTVRVELASGRSESRVGPSPPPTENAPLRAAAPARPAALPPALQEREMAGRLFSIVDGGAGGLRLQARDARSLQTLWDLHLTPAASKPAPRRP